MAHLPYRTGLTVIYAALKTICRIAAKYRDLWRTFMTESQLAKFDLLVDLCMDIIEIIDELRTT